MGHHLVRGFFSSVSMVKNQLPGLEVMNALRAEHAVDLYRYKARIDDFPVENRP